MKIGLINPNATIKNASIHIGLGYLVSYAKSKDSNLDFKLLDTRIATKKETEEFYNNDFDLVGITSSSQVFKEAVEIGNKIRSKFPKLPIILGGSHVSTVLKESIKNSPFDFAVYGEGEETFWDLIKYFKNKSIDLKNIKGLIYKDEKGEIIQNATRSLIHDIDKIPFPDYSIFKVEEYPQHVLTTSRGCPYDCVFCNSRALWTNKWRARSAQNIIDEIKSIVDKYGKKTFTFNDDSFNIKADRVIEFCDGLIDQRVNIIWSSSVRVDRITPQIASKMRQSGCYNVSIGIESANNDVLRAMNKNITKEKIYEGIQMFKNEKIDVMGQFMIGNPSDTLETVKESIEFAKNSNLTGVEFYTALPYPNSDLYEYVKTSAKMLTDAKIYEYHEVSPRIIFETPEFTYDDRLKAIQLATENGYYYALTHDVRNILLDTGRKMAKISQKIFTGKTGNKIYLYMRNMYRKLK